MQGDSLPTYYIIIICIITYYVFYVCTFCSINCLINENKLDLLMVYRKVWMDGHLLIESAYNQEFINYDIHVDSPTLPYQMHFS